MTDETQKSEKPASPAQQRAAIPSLKPSTVQDGATGDAVWVGCKLPHGLHMELIPEWKLAKAPPRGPRYTLRGANTVQTGIMGAAQGSHPYGITRIPRDFWEQWYERYKNSDFIVKGQIFALDKKKDVLNEAANRVNDVKTGMEALDPENDPRIKKLSQAGKPETRVTVDRQQLARLQRGMLDGAEDE